MKRQALRVIQVGVCLLVVSSLIAAASPSPAFLLTVSPTAEGILPLQTAHYKVTVSAFNGFAGDVSISCHSNSPHIQCAVSPDLIVFQREPLPSQAVNVKQVSMLATADSTTPPGTYEIEVFGATPVEGANNTAPIVELIVFHQ